MANEATRVSQNVKRSVQKAIAAAGFGVPVLFEEVYTADPGFDAWIDVHWTKRSVEKLTGGEAQVTWPVVLDVWSRISTDKLGGDLDALADTVLAWIRDRYVDLLDYSTPSAPVETGVKVRVSQQPGGDDPLPITDIVRGRSLTAEVVYFERQ